MRGLSDTHQYRLEADGSVDFWWATSGNLDSGDSPCCAYGNKSRQACRLRKHVIMPILDTIPDLRMPSDHATWFANKEVYHFLCELIVDLLLGPGLCIRPRPALRMLRDRGYLPDIHTLEFVRIQ